VFIGEAVFFEMGVIHFGWCRETKDLQFNVLCLERNIVCNLHQILRSSKQGHCDGWDHILHMGDTRTACILFVTLKGTWDDAINTAVK
jgi:hypothetical protein